MSDTPQKKVVRVEQRAQAPGAHSSGDPGAGPAWTPTPEAKAKATRLRWIAWAAWIVAIGLEAFAIFWVLKQVPVIFWLLIVLIVATGVLSVLGSLVWKQANRLDPASRQDAVRFFIQNQLGAIVAIIAFLPLIILIFMNKNMDGKQKAVAGGIGVVVLLIAAAFGISYDSPSQEQYAEETNIVQQLTGEDLVYWVKGGSVFHVCEAVPDVNKESADGQIYQGTVAAAHEAGKERLTKRWQSEAVNYCGYSDEQVAAVEAAVSGEGPAVGDPATGADEPGSGEAGTGASGTEESGTEETGTEETGTEQSATP
ncbi:hypothetical protein MUN78_05000 [Leucobacter allii]|uniref:Uncharacterized protein n=1 Tax=Leucobacter allii TaxID=2932247 RepID=A0ABY4FPN5_9MICO|nr:hypothetical protein [Leucobacter allii]UOQ58206.1 hypothetical protein MUN78_05000 [Leucobacter allii]